MNRTLRRGFTLVELLVVIAIIALLAAILFPVFESARDRARSASCLSNMKQIGTGILMYEQDNDERLFWRAVSSTSVGRTRIANPTFMSKTVDTAQYYPEQWYNMLTPYTKSTQVLACPSDPTPTLSPDPTGATIIPRSYVVSSAVESLSLPQVPDPTLTIVVTEKTSAAGDTWLDQMDGDALPSQANPAVINNVASWHQGGMNNAFFDGHAKWENPGSFWASADLTGCRVIHNNPAPQVNLIAAGTAGSLCDSTNANCPVTTGQETYSNALTGTDKNLCNAPTILS